MHEFLRINLIFCDLFALIGFFLDLCIYVKEIDQFSYNCVVIYETEF